MAENDNTAKRDTHRQALKDSTRWVCVLSDGETFDGLSGSWIAQTPDNFDEDNNLEDQILADNRIDLRGLLHWAIDQGYLDEDEDENLTMEVFMLIDDAHAHSALGLSISYNIVTQQHGGTIEVDSRVGEFTEFTVRLPRAFRATIAEAAS